MGMCEYCGKEEQGLLFTCPRCGQWLCKEHHLPEKHECFLIGPGIKPDNIFDKSKKFK
jgi:predicted nucleic acid binding AN1-type Zn finger protein